MLCLTHLINTFPFKLKINRFYSFFFQTKILCLKNHSLLARPPYFSSLSALLAHISAWGLSPPNNSLLKENLKNYSLFNSHNVLNHLFSKRSFLMPIIRSGVFKKKKLFKLKKYKQELTNNLISKEKGFYLLFGQMFLSQPLSI